MEAHTIPDGMKPAEYKAMCNQGHAEKRIKHRYDFDGEVLKAATSAIKSFAKNEVPLFRVALLRPDADHDSRFLYAVLVDSEWLPIVFCTKTDTPVTVLPQHALKGYEHILNPEHRSTRIKGAKERLRVATEIINSIYCQLKASKALKPFNPMIEEFLSENT